MPKLEAVDLSQYNTGVKYQKLHDDGVRHAWIRVWSGGSFDTAHEQHRLACQHVGIKCFAYWVANPALNPNEQMGVARQHCNDAVWDTHDGQPMWALDWEMAGLTLSWAQRFGQPPVLYRSLSTENVYPDARQWIADWNVPNPPVVHKLVAWQYRGGPGGIEGYADGRLDASETFFVDAPNHGGNVVTNADIMQQIKLLESRLHTIHGEIDAIAKAVGVPVAASPAKTASGKGGGAASSPKATGG